MSLLYDTKYNRKIADNVIALQAKKNPFHEPDHFNKPIEQVLFGGNRMIGGMASRSGGSVGSRSGGKRALKDADLVPRTPFKQELLLPYSPRKEVLAGAVVNTPRWTATELRHIDKMKNTTYAPNEIVARFVDTRDGYADQMEGGSFKGFLRGVKKVGKKVLYNPVVKGAISSALDVGAPLAGKALGAYLGQPALGLAISQGARKGVKEATGFGVGSYSGGSVGSYSGGSVVGSRSGGAKPKPKSKNKRAEIVKRVMKEQGMTLPQASKYVKEHNLY